VYYLDCYDHGAACGDKFPVFSYGPATMDECSELRNEIESYFTRTVLTQETKGQNPTPKYRWPPKQIKR
jgi:hypothetical protein